MIFIFMIHLRFNQMFSKINLHDRGKKKIINFSKNNNKENFKTV